MGYGRVGTRVCDPLIFVASMNLMTKLILGRFLFLMLKLCWLQQMCVICVLDHAVLMVFDDGGGDDGDDDGIFAMKYFYCDLGNLLYQYQSHNSRVQLEYLALMKMGMEAENFVKKFDYRKCLLGLMDY